MELLAKIINDWFTGIDGQTYDPARFLWFFGIVAFLTFTAIDIYRHDKFDMENFAFAYASLLAAGAAGVKIKETTEPLVPTPQPLPVPSAIPTPQVPSVPTVQPSKTVIVQNQYNITDDDIPNPPKN